jgi:phosphoribosyl-AMP cyclohydrolase
MRGFAKEPDKTIIETSDRLTPKFGPDGLITAVVTDAASGEVLMLAHMNAEALQRTIETGEGWYWSRSRQELWHKGATSGTVQDVVEMRVDCDQDAIWLKVTVRGHGATCHTGMRGCFYRRIISENGNVRLERDSEAPLFDPEKVYGGSGERR